MVDLDKAISAPAAVFESPEQVLEEGTLTDEQKCRVLQQWAYDLREIQVATDENMKATADQGQSAELLSRIEVALASLSGEGCSGTPAPTRQGGA